MRYVKDLATEWQCKLVVIPTREIFDELTRRPDSQALPWVGAKPPALVHGTALANAPVSQRVVVLVSSLLPDVLEALLRPLYLAREIPVSNPLFLLQLSRETLDVPPRSSSNKRSDVQSTLAFVELLKEQYAHCVLPPADLGSPSTLMQNVLDHALFVSERRESSPVHVIVFSGVISYARMALIDQFRAMESKRHGAVARALWVDPASGNVGSDSALLAMDALAAAIQPGLDTIIERASSLDPLLPSEIFKRAQHACRMQQLHSRVGAGMQVLVGSGRVTDSAGDRAFPKSFLDEMVLTLLDPSKCRLLVIDDDIEPSMFSQMSLALEGAAEMAGRRLVVTGVIPTGIDGP